MGSSVKKTPAQKSSPDNQSSPKLAIFPLSTLSPRALLPRRRQYKHAAIKQPTWQNPVLEYWEARHKRRRPTHQKAPRRVRIERQILAMLAFFSISVGLWHNFRQLWLQENGFSATDVSMLISLGMVVSVAGIAIAGKFVKMSHIKTFMTRTLFVRSVNLVLLSYLNGSQLYWLICICFLVDIISDALIVTSVYPLLTTVMKSNNTYSRRKLVEYLFKDVGIFIGGILIGQQIGGWLIDYNSCLLVAAGFCTVSSIILWRIRLDLTEKFPQDKFSAIKYVLRSKLHRTYMIYVFIGSIAYTIPTGLRMLVLTDSFDLSASISTNYLLIVGLASDVLGILALRFFTPKNDYITMSLKFGSRLLIFAAAFLSGNPFICFIALTWVLLTQTIYENISDGYYINAVDNRRQLKYNTLRYIVGYAGDAAGMFLCGQMYELGVPFIFGMAACFIIAQIIIAFYLISLRKKGTK